MDAGRAATFRRLMAEVTAHLEDAAGLAADWQGREPPASLEGLFTRITAAERLARAAATLAHTPASREG